MNLEANKKMGLLSPALSKTEQRENTSCIPGAEVQSEYFQFSS
jgi:hypothetical protein